MEKTPEWYKLSENLQVIEVINLFLKKSEGKVLFIHAPYYFNILKYVLRSPFKNSMKEDLIKAKHYIEMMLEELND
jgi:hypothetical protein